LTASFRLPITRILKRALLFVALLTISAGYAQEIQILSVDSSQYPNIRLSIAYKGKSRFESDELMLKQDDKNLAFTIRESAPGSAPEKGRAVFYLVEASSNTLGKGLIDIREGIIGSMDNLDTKDLVNIGWFGSYERDSSDMRLVSPHFTTEQANIRSLLQSKIQAKDDTVKRSDLYKNIVAGLDYLAKERELPQNRLFVVLSTARNNSSSPLTSSDCISKAKELGIPIYSITYLANDSAYSSGMMTRISARTGGKNVQCRTQISIINAITDFFNAPVPASMQESVYDVIFTANTEANPSRAKIDLSFRGNRQILIVADPNTGSLIPQDYKQYLWYSIGILGVIVLIMLLINLFSRRGSRATDEDSDSNSEQENPSTTVKKNTVVRPSTMLTEEKVTAPKEVKPTGPVVLVSLNGRTTPFPLVKADTTLGRHDTNDIALPEQTVTGKHAVIRMENGMVMITDLGSTNGTFVNGERIRTHEIKPGDRFRLGNVELTLK
jgi:hypothetical protein